MMTMKPFSGILLKRVLAREWISGFCAKPQEKMLMIRLGWCSNMHCFGRGTFGRWSVRRRAVDGSVSACM